jgi:hypothetical protein
MKIVEQSDLTLEQKARIVEMWNAEYPLSLSYSQISGFDEYLAQLGNKKHFLLIDSDDQIVGWALTFDRDQARWFAIIIDEKIQGKGFGIKLIEALKTAEKRLFGWVIDNDDCPRSNGQSYKSPLGFYRKTGFIVHENEKIVKEQISGVKIEWNKAGN